MIWEIKQKKNRKSTKPPTENLVPDTFATTLVTAYQLKQDGIIFIDFDPQAGHEQKGILLRRILK
jgi:hypothetical protein